jgi:hypothetical protein
MQDDGFGSVQVPVVVPGVRTQTAGGRQMGPSKLEVSPHGMPSAAGARQCPPGTAGEP